MSPKKWIAKGTNVVEVRVRSGVTWTYDKSWRAKYQAQLYKKKKKVYIWYHTQELCMFFMLFKVYFGRLKDEFSHGPHFSRGLRNNVWVKVRRK